MSFPMYNIILALIFILEYIINSDISVLIIYSVLIQ